MLHLPGLFPVHCKSYIASFDSCLNWFMFRPSLRNSSMKSQTRLPSMELFLTGKPISRRWRSLRTWRLSYQDETVPMVVSGLRRERRSSFFTTVRGGPRITSEGDWTGSWRTTTAGRITPAIPIPGTLQVLCAPAR